MKIFKEDMVHLISDIVGKEKIVSQLTDRIGRTPSSELPRQERI